MDGAMIETLLVVVPDGPLARVPHAALSDGKRLGELIRDDPQLAVTSRVLLASRGRRGDAGKQQETGFAVDDHLGEPSDISGDHRHFTGERLEGRASADEFFVMSNLVAKIDELIAAKA